MRFVLIRHGQTEWNDRNLFRGRLDVPLNGKGIQQAEAIGERLKNVQLAALYSSPLSRATTTAKAVAGRQGGDISVLEELTDFDFGQWQGLSIDEVKKRFPRIYRNWVVCPDRVRIPGAESLARVRARLITMMDHLVDAHDPDQIVALVAHGLVNKVLLCFVLGLENQDFWRIKQDNGAINLFEYTRGGAKVFLMNDLSHVYKIEDVISSMQQMETPLGGSGSMLIGTKRSSQNGTHPYWD